MALTGNLEKEDIFQSFRQVLPPLMDTTDTPFQK
jgi:hypothetical protein